jgi:hypothetical protein
MKDVKRTYLTSTTAVTERRLGARRRHVSAGVLALTGDGVPRPRRALSVCDGIVSLGPVGAGGGSAAFPAHPTSASH